MSRFSGGISKMYPIPHSLRLFVIAVHHGESTYQVTQWLVYLLYFGKVHSQRRADVTGLI